MKMMLDIYTLGTTFHEFRTSSCQQKKLVLRKNRIKQVEIL